MGILLKGGICVTGTEVLKADILTEADKIAAIGEDLMPETSDVKVIDVTGKLLFPGFIDAHTHFDLHVAGTVTADDFDSGSKAALLGGTTTVIDFATQYQGESLLDGIDNWKRKAAGKSSCDFGFHLAITDWNDSVKAELPDIIQKEGVTSFKLYTTYDTMVDDEAIYQILKEMKKYGGIVGFHCENDGVIKAMQLEAEKAGHTDSSYHAKVRPAQCEAEAIHRVLEIAAIVDTPVIIVHLTCEEGLREIKAARARGQKVYVETCPQYLYLNDDRYKSGGIEAARFVCAPPLRKQKDQDILCKALKEGEIQTVSTDHCSFRTEQKRAGLSDFTKIPGGLPGVQNRPLLLYTNQVAKDGPNRIDLTSFCKLVAENPAKLYGMYPKKGVLGVGSDADIVVLNPDERGEIHASELAHRVDYSPYENFPTMGKIEHVFLRGDWTVKNGQIIDQKRGRFLSRKYYSL